MMSLENYLAYILATLLILSIPGPTIILVISEAVTHGRKSVIPLVAGVVLGDCTAMVLSLMGLGAIMSTSAALFVLFKWVGAVYLFYLGINLWRVKPEVESTQSNEKKTSRRSLLRSSFIVTALNPKEIAFFVAFLPQFIEASKPVTGQITVLGGTFLFLALVNAAFYAFFATTLRTLIKRTKIRNWFNRCGGTALIGAGIITAGLRRAS